MMAGIANRGPGILDISGKALVETRPSPRFDRRPLKPDGSKENRT
jgi:hypothetical protein